MNKKRILENKMKKLLRQLGRAIEDGSSLDTLENLQEQIKETNKLIWSLKGG